MYCLSETQIDFILSDIRARGIEMESLQQNLLDHICCAIEHGLEEGGDFGSFYLSVITTFYHSELREIEVETANLLTNKHFYIMKKAMIVSGTASVVLLSMGIILKFLYLPGAAMLLVLGIGLLSFVFLPLMLALRLKENRRMIEKAVSGLGAASAILISVGVLFKIMHWPYANIMSSIALMIMIFLFIPVYYFTGIKNPATKVNTIVSSIMMLTGCILVLVLVRSPAGTKQQYVEDTAYFVQNNEILKTEEALSNATLQSKNSQEIYQLCEALKTFLIEKETGLKTLDANFEAKNALLTETWANVYFSDSPKAQQKMARLKKLITEYNNGDPLHAALMKTTMFDLQERVQPTLNHLVQIQMIVLQQQRQTVAFN